MPIRTNRSGLFLGSLACVVFLLGVVTGPVHAGPVYRCFQNGSVAYTQNASDPSCEPIEVNAYEPDPETVSQKKDELRKWRDDRSKALTEGRRKKTGRKQKPREPGTEGDIPNDLKSTTDAMKIPNELDFKEPTGEP